MKFIFKKFSFNSLSWANWISLILLQFFLNFSLILFLESKFLDETELSLTEDYSCCSDDDIDTEEVWLEDIKIKFINPDQIEAEPKRIKDIISEFNRNNASYGKGWDSVKIDITNKEKNKGRGDTIISISTLNEYK